MHNAILTDGVIRGMNRYSESEREANYQRHRDARHAAAELAIQADQRIEELEAKVIKLQEICDSRLDEINRLRFGSR